MYGKEGQALGCGYYCFGLLALLPPSVTRCSRAWAGTPHCTTFGLDQCFPKHPLAQTFGLLGVEITVVCLCTRQPRGWIMKWTAVLFVCSSSLSLGELTSKEREDDLHMILEMAANYRCSHPDPSWVYVTWARPVRDSLPGIWTGDGRGGPEHSWGWLTLAAVHWTLLTWGRSSLLEPLALPCCCPPWGVGDQLCAFWELPSILPANLFMLNWERFCS